MEDNKATPPEPGRTSPSGSTSDVQRAAKDPTTAPPALPLQPATRELLGFTLAIVTARRVPAATNLDVVLATLARLDRTKLDKVELERAASSSLVHVLPEPSENRIEAALSAAGVNPSSLASDPGATPGDPRLALVLEQAYALARRLGGDAVWSHHLVAAALDGDPLPEVVLHPLGVSQAQMRVELRSAIAGRWSSESPEVWDSVLGPVQAFGIPRDHDDTAVKWADDAPARQDQDLLHREALAAVLADRLRQIYGDHPGVSFLVHEDY